VTCSSALTAPTGNELAHARHLEPEAPLLASIARTGQTYRCSLPDGHTGPHREDWGARFGVEWGAGVAERLRPPFALPERRARVSR